jgi:outer membrane protein assembly factor BamB
MKISEMRIPCLSSKQNRVAPAVFLMFFALLVLPAAAQWQYDVTLTGYPQARWKATTSYIDKPALADINGDGRPEIIAAGLFGDVYALDGRTGQILWSYEDEHSLELAVYICPVTVDVSCDGVDDVVSITPAGKVIALDGRNGRRLWSFQADSQIVYSPSAFDLNRDGTAEIAVSDVSGNVYLISNLGKQLWKASGNAPLFGTPAMGMAGNQSIVIIGDRQGALRSLDGATGNSLWKYEPTPAAPVSTSPVFYKDTQNSTYQWRVLFGTENGNVHLLNAQNGQVIWSRRMTKGMIGEISLGDLRGTGGLELAFSTTEHEVITAHSTARRSGSGNSRCPCGSTSACRGRRLWVGRPWRDSPSWPMRTETDD